MGAKKEAVTKLSRHLAIREMNNISLDRYARKIYDEIQRDELIEEILDDLAEQSEELDNVSDEIDSIFSRLKTWRKEHGIHT